MYAGSPLRRVGKCDIGRWSVINRIRADSRDCAYGVVCGHVAYGAWPAWHMAQALDVRACAKRGCSSTFTKVVGKLDLYVGFLEEWCM